jgi:hypothetical protein
MRGANHYTESRLDVDLHAPQPLAVVRRLTTGLDSMRQAQPPPPVTTLRPADFRERVQRALGSQAPPGDHAQQAGVVPSVVLVALAADQPAGDPCGISLVLNKRSRRVRQPGDLCCPGGGIQPLLDRLGGGLLAWPGSPLQRSPLGRRWARDRSPEGRLLRTFLAAALREGFEEMRLNPLRVEFLGMLPRQELILFRRVIHPMVVWLHGVQRLRPNWEVESILRVPLHRLLQAEHYRLCRFHVPVASPAGAPPRKMEFPCFAHQTGNGTEWLWGATYRIVMSLLHIVLGYAPPPEADLPLVTRTLDSRYLGGP